MTNAPIVVGVDGSPSSSDAVRWATREAGMCHAPLLILSCVSYRGAEAVPCIGTELRARAERDLAAAVGIAQTQNRGGGVEIRTEVHAQYAPAALVDCSDSARMIVVGRRGLGEFTGGLLGSVSSIVARHARCPVAVIEGWSRIEDGAGPVVVGVDGSANSAAAIDVAFEECDCVVLNWLRYTPGPIRTCRRSTSIRNSGRPQNSQSGPCWQNASRGARSSIPTSPCGSSWSEIVRCVTCWPRRRKLS